jgi:dihydrolipoamide dehydrogenase
LQEEFDLIVIGSGSGLDVANAAAELGLKVAIIEKNRMGGTCLNRGCIPSKLLIHSADIAEIIRHADIFGIKVDSFSVDFPKIVQRVNTITDLESDQIKNTFESIENPKLFTKECKFVSEKTLYIERTRSDKNMERGGGGGEDLLITAPKILIASGTRPRIPKIKGLNESGYITSDEALRLRIQPKVLTIIGGGYIGCELAHFYGSLGTKINIVQHDKVLIPNEDEEISHKFTEIFSKKYNVYLGYNTESISKKKGEERNDDMYENNNNVFHVEAKTPQGEILELDSDQLLIASGRIPNSDTLDLEKTGVKVNKKGYVITNRYLETNIEGIFALGDAIGRYLFKHSANHEAQYAYNNILHPDDKIPVNYAAMPHAIFTSPQVAGVGLKEQELKANRNIDYQKSVYPYIKTAMGKAIGDNEGFVKFLVDKKDKKILGCHIIGSDASSLIHEVLVAMKAGHGIIGDIVKTIHIHPALSEVVVRAASEI